MDSRSFAVSVTVILGLMVAALAVIGYIGVPGVFVDDYEPVVDSGDVSSITYVTNGGTLSGEYQRTYVEGTYVPLPVPVCGDRFFEGWFTDEDLETPLGAITPGMRGDIVLYASWSDFDPIGHGFVMDVMIKYGEGMQRVVQYGTMSWSYMTMADGAYYIQRMTVWNGGEPRTDGYWTDETGSDAKKYIGNGIVDGKVCEMWSDGTETLWQYRGFTPMKIEYVQGTNYHLYTLRESVSFEPYLIFEPMVSTRAGISVEYEHLATIGSDLTLTASGDRFYGWYVNSTFYSKERTITIHRVDPGTDIEAVSVDGYSVVDGSIVSPGMFGLSGQVTVSAQDRTTVSSGTGPFSLGPGFYTMETSDGGLRVYEEFFVEEHRTFSHSWTYSGREYSLSMDLLYSMVFLDGYPDNMRGYRFGMGPESDSRYLSPDCSYVSELAGILGSYSEGMDSVSRAEFVLMFVQTIPYLTDDETRNISEYWKYPAETLWDGGGDCEDSSILYASLMNALGYSTAVAVFSDHAMAGIVLDGDTGGKDTFTSGGTTYVFAETTNTNLGFWKTGHGYSESRIYYVVVPSES